MPRRLLAVLLAATVPLGPIACGTSPATPPGEADLAQAAAIDADGAPDLAMAATADLAVAADLAAGADLTAGPDLSASVYPAGPYGSVVGAVIPNLAWQGYVNDAADAISTTKPFVLYSMDALRLSGKRYAMVHVSEFI